MKRLVFKLLPARLLRVVRTVHYHSSLKKYRMESEPDLRACRQLVKEGDTVLDIGANIGVYTRFCSEFAGPKGRVISLEPIPETYGYLTSNVRALKLNNVQCLNLAASDRDSDSARMSVPEYSTGGANLYEATLSTNGNIEVKTAKLDSLFPDICPSFIKCDVEGHEIACIRGGMELIARCRPKWMVEVSKQETFALFESLNYSAFIWRDGTFVPVSGPSESTNYFFFPTD